MKRSFTGLLLLFLLFFGFATSIWSQSTTLEKPTETQQQLSWPEVVAYAKKHLPQEGVLVRNPDGFTYIKVDDAYIHDLFPMLNLKEEGYTEPPYFRSPEAPGAHISVFYVDEKILPEELGRTFPFELNDIVIVKPKKDTSYAVLQVTSPELEALRVKYGLSPKLHGHEYHISIAKKVFRK